MILNGNVSHSLDRGENVFANYDDLVEGDQMIRIDVHPLYGHLDPHRSPSYLWSYGFYLNHPFMHDTAGMHETPPPTPPPTPPLMRDRLDVAYYVVFDGPPSDAAYTRSLGATVRADVALLRAHPLVRSVAVYAPFEHDVLEASSGLAIAREYHLPSVFREASLVACNAYSTLFWLACECGVNVTVLRDDPYHLYRPFFVRLEEEDVSPNNPRTRLRILQFASFAKEFEVCQPPNVGIRCFQVEPFKRLSLAQSIVACTASAPVRERRVFVHPQASKLYNMIRTGIARARGCSALPPAIAPKHASVWCVFVFEGSLCRSLLRGPTRLVAFDDNPFAMTKAHGSRKYRYHISTFDARQLPQRQDENDFVYMPDINYAHDGRVVCVLDNSKGLFHNTPREWQRMWRTAFHSLASEELRVGGGAAPLSRVWVKPHPNDTQNTTLEALREEFGFVIVEDPLEHILHENRIRMCVVGHGSAYIKCLQYGTLPVRAHDDRAHDDRTPLQRVPVDGHAESRALREYVHARRGMFLDSLRSVVDAQYIESGCFFEDAFDCANIAWS